MAIDQYHSHINARNTLLRRGAMHKVLLADGVLEKPFPMKEIETIVDRVIDRHR